jgi:hypothetical protein
MLHAVHVHPAGISDAAHLDSDAHLTTATGVRWVVFQRIKAQFPLLRPKLYLPYQELQAIAAL